MHDGAPLLESARQLNNALEDLYAYFIKEAAEDNPIPFDKGQIGILIAEVLAASSAVYLVPISEEYGKTQPPGIAESVTFAGVLVNVLFLLKATDDLFKKMRVEFSKPDALKHLLKLRSKLALVIKYGQIVLGSLAAAVPFAVLTYLFRLKGCESNACGIATTIHALLSNAVLHMISLELILARKIYRLPLIPFEMLGRYLYGRCRPISILEQKQQEIYQRYRTTLRDEFTRVAHTMVRGYANGKINAETLKQLSKEASFANFARYAPNGSLPAESPLRSAINKYANGAMGALGAVLMMFGMAGWAGSPVYLDGKDTFSFNQRVAMGSLPAYATVVLCAFFGEFIFKQIYGWLTSWGGGLKNKFSIEAKLYPKTFAIFLAINLYISAFGYGPARQLIITVFGDHMWDAYRPHLENLSIPASDTLFFVSLLDLFSTLIRVSAAKYKVGRQSDDQMAARLLVKAEALFQRLEQLDGEALMASIAEFTPEQKEAYGISRTEFANDQSTLGRLKQQITEMLNKAEVGEGGNEIPIAEDTHVTADGQEVEYHPLAFPFHPRENDGTPQATQRSCCRFFGCWGRPANTFQASTASRFLA